MLKTFTLPFPCLFFLDALLKLSSSAYNFGKILNVGGLELSEEDSLCLCIYMTLISEWSIFRFVGFFWSNCRVGKNRNILHSENNVILS